jgi:hypothetical protein
MDRKESNHGAFEYERCPIQCANAVAHTLIFAKKTVVFPGFKLYANKLDVWPNENKCCRDASLLICLDDRGAS